MKKQGFLYGSIILIASALVAKLIGAIFKIPLTNMLGGTGMGYFSCAYGLFLPIYAITVTGLTTAVAKLTAENSAFERFENIRKIKRIAMLIFSIIGLVGSVLIFLLAKPFCEIIVKSPQSYLSVLVIAPSVFFGCVMSVYKGYYEGLRNMYPTALSQVAEALVKLVVGLGFCYWVLANESTVLAYIPAEKDIDIVAIAAAASVMGVTLSSVVGTLYLMVKNLCTKDCTSSTSKDTHTDSSKTISKELFRILVPVSVGALITSLSSLIDLGTIIRCLDEAIAKDPQFFIDKFKITEEIGINALSNFIYGSFTGLALTVFNLVPSITNMFGKGVLPSVAEAWAKKDKARLKTQSEGVLLATATIAFPSGFGICVLARQILSFLYSTKTEEVLVSYESLIYLGVGVIMLCLTTPIFSMLQAIGRADLPLKIMLVGVALKFLGNIVLISIPTINVTGAGISTMVSYMVILVLSIISFSRESGTKLSYGKIFYPACYSAFLCAMAAFLAYNISNIFLSDNFSLFISIAFGGIIYLVGMYLFGGVDKENLKKMLF